MSLPAKFYPLRWPFALVKVQKRRFLSISQQPCLIQTSDLSCLLPTYPPSTPYEALSFILLNRRSQRIPVLVSPIVKMAVFALLIGRWRALLRLKDSLPPEELGSCSGGKPGHHRDMDGISGRNGGTRYMVNKVRNSQISQWQFGG
jgi:hypothetical protein